mmetsp:Transcript_47952/g.126519  ORF Transcript_47952/g.126519 Transcript_47952/m.126519 type:complete len:102 (+) Transcript_47952:1707-2012(+)
MSRLPERLLQLLPREFTCGSKGKCTTCRRHGASVAYHTEASGQPASGGHVCCHTGAGGLFSSASCCASGVATDSSIALYATCASYHAVAVAVAKAYWRCTW